MMKVSYSLSIFLLSISSKEYSVKIKKDDKGMLSITIHKQTDGLLFLLF